MRQWGAFIHERTDLDALVRMAIQHLHRKHIAVHAAIHPSPDGIGRKGYMRMLNILGQIQAAWLDRPTLQSSGYVLRFRADPDPRPGRVTCHAEWEPWIPGTLGAAEKTSPSAARKIKAVRASMGESLGPMAASQSMWSLARADVRAEERPGRDKIIPHGKDLDALRHGHGCKSCVRRGELARPKQRAQAAT